MDQVFIAFGVTSLRKSVDGQAAIVQDSFRLDPFSSHLFVFCNRKKDKLKNLHWDQKETKIPIVTAKMPGPMYGGSLALSYP
jgi:transposase